MGKSKPKSSVKSTLWIGADAEVMTAGKGIVVIEAADVEIIIPVKELHRIVEQADKLAG
jgi:hypothetical protein